MMNSFFEDKDDLRKHGSPFPFQAPAGEPKRVVDAINSLNQLAGFKFDPSRMQQPCRPPTKVQMDMLSHVRDSVDACGRRPQELDGKSSLLGLARNFAPYDGMPSNLADFDIEKIKILQSQLKPKKLCDLLPTSLQPLIQNFEKHIERDPLHVQADLAKDPELMPKIPYWDPTLRNSRDQRLDLYKKMFDKGSTTVDLCKSWHIFRQEEIS